MTISDDVTIRTSLEPGDIGRITGMHGVLYAMEYGWDYTFEAYVGEYLSQFALRYAAGSPSEQIWVAERDGEIVGCVAIVRGSGAVASGAADSAQLRWFLVDPSARGTGLGRRLLAEAVSFARAAGYKRIFLDTVSDLTAAARLYTAAGFSLAAESRGAGWGSEVTEQRYEMVLRQ